MQKLFIKRLYIWSRLKVSTQKQYWNKKQPKSQLNYSLSIANIKNHVEIQNSKNLQPSQTIQQQIHPAKVIEDQTIQKTKSKSTNINFKSFNKVLFTSVASTSIYNLCKMHMNTQLVSIILILLQIIKSNDLL